MLYIREQTSFYINLILNGFSENRKKNDEKHT